VIQQKSKYQQYVDQAVSDLLVYGNSDAVWATIRIRARDKLNLDPVVDARSYELYAQRVIAAHKDALENKERNDLRRAILAAQQEEGL
jgi:hypothetical protein